MTYQYHGRLQWLAVLTILMEINQGDIADLPGQGSYAGYVSSLGVSTVASYAGFEWGGYVY